MRNIFRLGCVLFLLGGIAYFMNSPQFTDIFDGKVNFEMQQMQASMINMPCHKMGDVWMGQCDFDENGDVIMNDTKSEGLEGEGYETSITNLPYAKAPIVVNLRDGETYEMTADFVQQEIGGRTLRRLAYNGMIPGPIFQVPQDAKITLNFTNNIDEETTIHSHGLRHDYTMDGVPDVPHPAIQPGEKFAYTLTFPDAGIFWYHPHVREDRQQDLGLYGNYIVESNDEDYWTQNIREESWILDDLSLEPYFQDKITHAIMGRFGDIQLINNEESYQTTAKAGETVRYFVTNTANVRPFQLKIPGAQMKLVGGDIGRIEQEKIIGEEGVLVAPAERWIIEVYYPKVGTYEIQNSTPDGVTLLGKVEASKATEDSRDTFQTLRDNRSDFSEIREYAEKIKNDQPDKRLRIDIDMAMMEMDMQHGMHEAPEVEWNDQMGEMNRVSTDEDTTWKLIDEDTGDVNEAIDWHFDEGERVVIEIYNDPDTMHPMQHPIHFHGQRFLVLDRDGKPNKTFQWKDTAMIKTGERIKILLENTTPGVWMAHCHISEHMHTGMMFSFTVGDKDQPGVKHSH